MPVGPGKYEPECSMVRQQAGLMDDQPGGAIVIVFGGNRGSGFAVQADPLTTLALPDFLEDIAKQIRASLSR